MVDINVIRVAGATGPYAGDERSRYRYRSNPAAAQSAIDAHARNGLLYLGEWHSHAEDHPSASEFDSDAMRRLLTSSRLNTNALLMLIVGRIGGPDGLALLTVAPFKAHRWSLSPASG